MADWHRGQYRPKRTRRKKSGRTILGDALAYGIVNAIFKRRKR